MPFLWWRRKSASTTTASGATRGDRPFFFLGNRRYVADAPYMLPKDETEIGRLDMQHFLLRQAMRGLYAAPIDQPAAILDVGTGTGRWAVEMAQRFPNANVIAVDLRPPPADEGRAAVARPDNYTFVEGNVVEGLSFAPASFDFVHQRLLVAALRADDWPRAVAELARLTRRGGWIELVEGDFARGGGAGLQTINGWVDEACRRRGIDFSMGGRIGQLLQGAGLVQVRQIDVVVPMGIYGGHLGTMMQTDYFRSLDALQALVVQLGVTDASAYQGAVAQAAREVAAGGVTVPFFVAFGQHP